MAMFNSEMLVYQRVMLMRNICFKPTNVETGSLFSEQTNVDFFYPTTTLIDTVNPTYYHKPNSYMYYNISIYIYIIHM